MALLTNEDGRAAQQISEILRRAGQPVPDELLERLSSGEMRFPAPRDPLSPPRDRDRDLLRLRDAGELATAAWLTNFRVESPLKEELLVAPAGLRLRSGSVRSEEAMRELGVCLTAPSCS